MTQRLDRLLSLADPVEAMADIGTDHGFVSYAYLKKNLAQYVYAIDISEPSLEKAKKTLWPFTGHYACLLGDGLKPLKKGQVQALVIAGMGGRSIANILDEGEDLAKDVDYLLIQAMQGEEILLRYLREEGYGLLAEALAFERGKYYRILKITGKNKGEEISLEEPRLLLESGDPLLKDYLHHHLERLEEVKENLQKAKTLSPRSREWLEVTRKENQIRSWLHDYCGENL